MACGAGDAVARQHAVIGMRGARIVGRPRHRIDHLAREVGALAGLRLVVDVELALAADAVAAEADILHHAGHVGMEALRLAGELREEDRVAAAQSHRRRPPRREGRQVEEVVAMRVRLGHVELQPGAAGIVAAEALARRDECVGGVGTACSRPMCCRRSPTASSRRCHSSAWSACRP